MSDTPAEAQENPEDITLTGAVAVPRVDSVTGEILPDTIAMGRELATLPEEFGDLAAYFAAPEPSAKEVMLWIMGEDQMSEADPEETSRAIMARILAADSAFEVLSGHRVVHAQDIMETPIKIHAVKWQRSTLEGPTACYAVIDAQRLDEEGHITVTTSGRNVMVQLLKLQHGGYLPVVARISQSTNPTARGYRPLWLEPA